MKSIAIFNNKGGVGKTTLTCNLASFISTEKKCKVLVIDADPQCNTSTYVLDEDQFEKTYYNQDVFTIYDVFKPIENADGYVKSFDVLQAGKFNFELLPGNPKLAMMEDLLASDWRDVMSSTIRGTKTTMVFNHILSLCQSYDYVFFDVSPSLGAINRSILLACDYFVTPMSADIFSLLALENMGSSIFNWQQIFNEAIYKIESQNKEIFLGLKGVCNIKFLGYVEQQYITKTVDGSMKAVKAYDTILKQIPEKIDVNLVKKINKNINNIDYSLGSIPNFYSLIPMSQNSHKPIISLTSVDGVIGSHYNKVELYRKTISAITGSLFANMEAMK